MFKQLMKAFYGFFFCKECDQQGTVILTIPVALSLKQTFSWHIIRGTDVFKSYLYLSLKILVIIRLLFSLYLQNTQKIL